MMAIYSLHCVRTVCAERVFSTSRDVSSRSKRSQKLSFQNFDLNGFVVVCVQFEHDKELARITDTLATSSTNVRPERSNKGRTKRRIKRRNKANGSATGRRSSTMESIIWRLWRQQCCTVLSCESLQWVSTNSPAVRSINLIRSPNVAPCASSVYTLYTIQRNPFGGTEIRLPATKAIRDGLKVRKSVAGHFQLMGPLLQQLSFWFSAFQKRRVLAPLKADRSN